MIKTSRDFGQIIRARRAGRGITQDQLAARCGVARRFIIDLEAGKPTCQLGKALTVAVELGLRLEDCDGSAGGNQSEPHPGDPLSHLPKF